MWLPVEQQPGEMDCVFTASGVFEKSSDEGLIIVETQEHECQSIKVIQKQARVCLLVRKPFLLYTH